MKIRFTSLLLAFAFTFLFSPHLLAKEENQRITKGKILTCDILRGTLPKISDQTESLNQIIDVMWYLYSLAEAKGEGFTSGTFVIKDPDSYFYNFLMNYVKFVNKKIKGTKDDTAHHVSLDEYAYSRASSHFKLSQKEHRQYGIDVRFSGKRPKPPIGGYLPIPKKTHILFGKIDKTRMFIKMEEVGLKPGSVLLHGILFVKVVLIPKLKDRLEPLLKHIPEEERDIIAHYLGGKEKEEKHRREKIPQEFFKNCLGILEKATNITQEKRKEHVYNFSTQGIQYLYKITTDRPEELSAQLKEFEQYLKELEKEYNHLDIRHGREVIFTQDDLKEKCPAVSRA